MKKTALLTVVLVSVSYPLMAKTQRTYRAWAHDRHVRVTCDMVRAYVSQVGLLQAKAMAESVGLTASEQQRAMRCLEKNT